MASTSLAAVRKIRRAQRADGPAAMLGIGTANPAYYVLQDEFPDYYFHITKMEHLTDLKDTFSKLCMYNTSHRRYEKYIAFWFIYFELHAI